MVFIVEEFLQKKIQRKEYVFEHLTTRLMRGGTCETVWMWRLVKAYKVIGD